MNLLERKISSLFYVESIASGSSDGDLKISLRFHFYARINFIRSMISSSRAPPRRAGRPLLVGPWRKGLHRPSEPALLLKTDIDPRLVSPLWVKSRHVQRVSPCPLCANSGHEQRLVFLTWVVSWIDVIDAARASELNLEDRLLASSPSVVGMLCRVHPQRAWL